MKRIHIIPTLMCLAAIAASCAKETGTPEEVRKIYDGKKLIEEISIIDDPVTIKNHLRGYEYKLTKIEE